MISQQVVINISMGVLIRLHSKEREYITHERNETYNPGGEHE